MAITCPQCSQTNPDQSGFCVRCGNRLPQPGQTGQFGTGPGNASLPTYISSPPPASPSSSTYLSSPPAASSFSPSTGTQSASFPPTTGYPPPSAGSWSTSSLAPPPPGPQIGTVQSPGSFRRAFAGHGIIVMHHSWLLNGDYAHASAVRDIFRDKIRQRNIPKLVVNPEMLAERGILMEEREYVVAQRGVASVFTYIAPAGQDLYISRATTVLPAISNIRVALLGLLALIMFIAFVSRPSYDPFNPVSIYAYLFVSFLSGLSSISILLFFIVLLIRSFIAWLVEKDFWRYLRPNVLNDFQLDDIALLEQVTDDVLRGAVEQTGLDASKIVRPPLWYQPRPKIRTF